MSPEGQLAPCGSLARGESFVGGVWDHPENNVSQLVLTADFAVAAVPEPSTWAMMIIGLALASWRIVGSQSRH
jgi:hypothetical protein